MTQLTFDIDKEIFGLSFYFEIVGDYSPGREAQTYGPPERCYPAEPSEFSITSVHLVQIQDEILNKPFEIKDWESLETEIYEEADRAYQASEEAAYEARAEDYAERRGAK